MIPLIVAGSVLLLILLLLFAPAKARITSSGDLTLRAGLGFITFRILPKRKKRPPRLSSFSQKKYLKKLEREAAEERKPKREKKKKKKEEAPKKKKSFSEKFDEIRDLLEFIVRATGKYSKRLRITLDKLMISVGAEEPSDTAIRYGAVSQGVAYLLGFLDENVNLKVRDGAVAVNADFLSGKFDVSADVTVGMLVIDAVRIALYYVADKIKKNNKSK